MNKMYKNTNLRHENKSPLNKKTMTKKQYIYFIFLQLINRPIPIVWKMPNIDR